MGVTATRGNAGFRPVIICWLATRGLLLAVALHIMATNRVGLTHVLDNWDVGHYTAIATSGYADQLDVAFFWGLPALMWTISRLGVDMVVGAAVLAQLASALSAWALHRIGGPWVACCWLLLPMTVFTAVPYTEPFFCAAAFWAWQRGMAARWGQAAVLAALACTLRISGLFLIAALAVLAWTQAGRAWRKRITDSCWLLLPVAVLAAFVVFLWVRTGSWTAWYSAQGAGWQRNLSWPWEALQATLPLTAESYWPGRPEVPVMFRFEIVAVAVGYLTVAYALVKRQWAAAAWVGANVVALSSSGWFMSVNRAVLLWFPLCALLVGLATWRPAGRGVQLAWRLCLVLVLIVDVAVMAWWAYCFGTGRWAS